MLKDAGLRFALNRFIPGKRGVGVRELLTIAGKAALLRLPLVGRPKLPQEVSGGGEVIAGRPRSMAGAASPTRKSLRDFRPPR